MLKRCSKCRNLKLFKEFSRNKTKPDGFSYQCKLCIKIYFEQNHVRRQIYGRQYRASRKEKQSSLNSRYYYENRDKILAHKRQYYHDNWDTVAIKAAARNQLRYQTIVSVKLAANLRARLRKALHRNQKSGSAVRDLGCSIISLKQHLESKFQTGMLWENYGKWHIDHIVPLSKFDLTNREQFLEACHYTNLQPLWAEDHIKKTVMDNAGPK